MALIISPSTVSALPEPGTNLSDREKLELRNLMQERTRLLGLKKGESINALRTGGASATATISVLEITT